VASPTTDDLAGVWGSGASDVWAVGAGVIHWDGTAWSVPAGAPRGPLSSVAGSGPGDVWAVGDSAWRWDGAAWSSLPSAAPKMQRVALGGPGDAWVLSEGVPAGVYHWGGAAWALSSPPAGGVLTGLWASGPNDVTVVGWFSNASNHGFPDAIDLHWDGSAWTRTYFRVSLSFTAVWGSRAGDLWKVGHYGVVVHNGDVVPSPLIGHTRLLSVGGSDEGHVWAVGAGGVIARLRP
jgi:hypothetical protein